MIRQSLNPNQLPTKHHNLINTMLADLEGKPSFVSSEALLSEAFIAKGIKVFNEVFIAKGIKVD